MNNRYSSLISHQFIFGAPDKPSNQLKRDTLRRAVNSQLSTENGDGADSEKPRLSRPVIRLDERTKRAVVDGATQHLSPTEYRLLQLLLSCPGQVFSNDEIIDWLWPERENATSADVKQYVFLLRQKIERDPKRPRYLLNERGFGYRLSDD